MASNRIRLSQSDGVAMKRLPLVLLACHWAIGLNLFAADAPTAPVTAAAKTESDPNDALSESERKEFKTLLFNAQFGLNRLEPTEQQRSEIEKWQESLKELIGKQFDGELKKRREALKTAGEKAAELQAALEKDVEQRATIIDRRLDALFAKPINPRDVFVGKRVKIVHVADGKVLGVLRDSADVFTNETCLGAQAVLVDDKAIPARRWLIVNENGYHKLVNCNSGQILDVKYSLRTAGAPILQWKEWEPPGSENQRWNWDDAKEIRIRSKPTGMVVDVGDDNLIVQNPEDNTAQSQLWRFVDAENEKE
jgi:hypothetical protein